MASENESANVSPSLSSGENKSKERFRWIDQSRGLVILYLVVDLVFPPEQWEDASEILWFFFEHGGKDFRFMTVLDFGAAAFMFMIGFMMSVSYIKRKEKSGTKKAIFHHFLRYIMLLLAGLLIIVFDGFQMWKWDNNMLIIEWGVVEAIGFVGFTAFPFILIKNVKIRLAAGYLWALFYQFLMLYAGLKDYAMASVFGGIFGTIFGYTSIVVIASCLGEYMILGEATAPVKRKNFLILGITNLVIGLGIAIPSYYLPSIGWEAMKRQVSFTHNLISIGVTVLGMSLFIFLDQVKNKKITYLSAFGANTFLVYSIATIPEFIIRETVGTDLGIPPWGNFILLAIFLSYISAVVIFLYKKKKTIPTELVALVMFFVVIGLGVLLVVTGVI